MRFYVKAGAGSKAMRPAGQLKTLCIDNKMKKQREIDKDGLIVTHFGGLHTYDDA